MLDTDIRAALVCVGANIARLRKRAGMTQAQLAERLDCEPSYLQKLEYATAVPSLPMLVRVAGQLGVKIGALFRAAKPVPSKPGRPRVRRSRTPR